MPSFFSRFKFINLANIFFQESSKPNPKSASDTSYAEQTSLGSEENTKTVPTLAQNVETFTSKPSTSTSISHLEKEVTYRPMFFYTVLLN